MKDEVPVWKRAGCCKACWFAKGKKCKCKCGGQNHAHGRSEPDRNLDNEFPLNAKAQQFFSRLITKSVCICGYDLLHEEPIMAYEHENGWTVKGYKKHLWLFVKCPKCKYSWSLGKLGVPRAASNMNGTLMVEA